MSPSQLGLTFAGWTLREPERGVIQPPPTYANVADGVAPDPETGPHEVPPCPPLDDFGTTYWVGTEQHVWSWQPDGMHVPDGRGVLADLRAILDEMKARGARISYQPGRWMPDRRREHVNAPLLWVTP